MTFSIAIDGPAGAGKSTVARAVAKELGYVYIDTGAMYRAAALYCLNEGIPLHNEKAVSDAVNEISIRISSDEGSASNESPQQVFLNNENVSKLIRTEEVGRSASIVSQYSLVREKLVLLQQEMAKKTSVVMDGRDIGTKVLPGADRKFYLTASSEVRAKRRYLELLEKGVSASLPEIQKEVEERDARDMGRKNSPLVKADDAILIDSSNMDINETIDAILDKVLR